VIVLIHSCSERGDSVVFLPKGKKRKKRKKTPEGQRGRQGEKKTGNFCLSSSQLSKKGETREPLLSSDREGRRVGVKRKEEGQNGGVYFVATQGDIRAPAIRRAAGGGNQRT